MPEELFNHTQAFQQAIATTVTCRTLIKYNSNLNPEQKTEILNEIETTLAFLGQRLEMNTSLEADTTLSPEKLADFLISDSGIKDEEGEELLGAHAPATQQELREISLQQLYQLYRTHLSNEPGKGITAIETRYKSVMSVLDRLQELAALRPDATASDLTVDELLSRVRGFISGLYYTFHEFASLFSKIIEGQSIEVNTEAMAMLQEGQREAAQQIAHDLTPLMRAYEKQCRVQQRRGPLRESARDATAFLVFLQESLEQTFARRQEIVSQIKSIAGLLNELIALLIDYELAITRITQSPSTSR